MMFNASQNDVGSERNGRDLRQCRLLDRRNRLSCKRNQIAMWFLLGGSIVHIALANDAGHN